MTNAELSKSRLLALNDHCAVLAESHLLLMLEGNHRNIRFMKKGSNVSPQCDCGYSYGEFPLDAVDSTLAHFRTLGNADDTSDNVEFGCTIQGSCADFLLSLPGAGQNEIAEIRLLENNTNADNCRNIFCDYVSTKHPLMAISVRCVESIRRLWSTPPPREKCRITTQ